jgi:hypothetical protein
MLNSPHMRTLLPTILAVAFALLVKTAAAQEEQPPQNPMIEGRDDSPSTPLKDRFFFGGSIGLQFGDYTYIDVSPMVGFKVTEKLHAGLGFTYIYLDAEVLVNNTGVKRYSTSDYGGRIFGRYYIWENFFGHTEFEVLNMGYPVYYNPPVDKIEILRETITSWFVGGGYNQEIGPNTAIQFMVLWNLTEEPYSPYSNPIFRIGIAAGF